MMIEIYQVDRRSGIFFNAAFFARTGVKAMPLDIYDGRLVVDSVKLAAIRAANREKVDKKA